MCIPVHDHRRAMDLDRGELHCFETLSDLQRLGVTPHTLGHFEEDAGSIHIEIVEKSTSVPEQ